jgi:hypothetical protein
MKALISLIFISPVLFFASCKKETTPPFIDAPIIQGYLLAGTPVSINISRQTPLSSDAQYSSDNINALSVLITTNNTTYTLTPLGNGQYVDSSLIVTTSATYNLSFTFNGKIVTASTSIPSKPTHFGESESTIAISDTFSSPNSHPSPVRVGWSNPDASYYTVVVQNVQPNAVEIDTSTNAPSFSFSPPPTNSDSTLINSMQFKYYGKTLLILYHVNADYASLYINRNSSSQNLTNPTTDITNGYGIFTGLNSDTLKLQVNN